MKTKGEIENRIYQLKMERGQYIAQRNEIIKMTDSPTGHGNISVQNKNIADHNAMISILKWVLK